MMTELQAIQRVAAEYHSRLKDAGLMPTLIVMQQAGANGDEMTMLDISRELEAFPIWRAMLAAIERKRISEECSEAFHRYQWHQANGSEESEDALGAFMRAFESAPEWLRDEFDEIARELDLIPDATGYLDDGTPMVSLEAIATKLGISDDKAQEAIEKFLAARVAEGLPIDGVMTDGRLIHGVQ